VGTGGPRHLHAHDPRESVHDHDIRPSRRAPVPRRHATSPPGALVALGDSRIVGAARRIFQEHGQAQGFWFIRDGFVDLDVRPRDRGDAVVETLGPGAVLGWSWLFPPYHWHFGAVTTEPMLAIAVDGAATRSYCDAEPAFGYELNKRFMAIVVKRLQATRMRLIAQ
jgi:CRP-like cAMP-binding protein